MKAVITIIIDNIENYGDFENSSIPEMEQVVRIQLEDGDIDLRDERVQVEINN
jgi:hypothetical protein